MSGEIVDIADLDVIYLSYDEPRKEEFWVKIQNMIPWAKRVDGVEGSDAAHKAAAEMSDTERFVLIDGDNLPDPEFFNLQLKITEENKDWVFRWKALNEINGLRYGNGGLSCWTKKFVQEMRTHENTDGTNETLVEFCFDPRYKAMHDCYSTTYPNGSAFHAWRAGFREGVKMCLDKGAKPTLQEFEKRVVSRNYDNLCIWQSVGADVEFGEDAIYGARLGTFLTMLTEWDYSQVRDFRYLETLYHEKGHPTSADLHEILTTRLALPIVSFNKDESKFFKHHYARAHQNLGTTVTEIDVIRRIEGW